MQLKNNKAGNVHFFFHREASKDKPAELDYIHIPGNATVEIEDKIFNQLCASRTRVNVQERVVTPLECEVPVTLDRKQVNIVDYFPTGEVKYVNLLLDAIKEGTFTIVDRPAVTMKVIDEVLTGNGVDISKMGDDQKLALYDKLV